jgi:ligand-binding SRPBCC domain-containing protein
LRDRVHELSREHWVEAPLEQAFDFFSDALRLQAVTPPWLAFRMLTPGPIEVGPGTLLDYRLRVHGIPIRWQTRIETWEPPRRFVDRQLKGPYKLWVHTHIFEARDGGTLVGDHVRYALPLGPLGELAHRAVVRRDLERIFDYRHEALTRLLGG